MVNLINGVPPLRYKQSSMPFIQMENISHYLKACQSPPLNLPPHDLFSTVDLYEAKDPAQVVQCIGAFSRRANALQPNRFPNIIGAKSKGILTPQGTGTSNGVGRSRAESNGSETSSSARFGGTGRMSPTKSYNTGSRNAASPPGGISSWSKKQDEGNTMPAWNIHQYGYMGGASQGNQGITFGARRQITTPAPHVPSLAEKERKRREQEAEAERQRIEVEEAERRRRAEIEAEEERARIAEEKRWEEETRKKREQERREVDLEKRRWEAEERRWKEEEEIRLREEKEVEARLQREREQKRTGSDARLQGQFLSQYKAEQRQQPAARNGEDPALSAERQRVKDLERQLAEAKEREMRYEQERLGRMQSGSKPQSSNYSLGGRDQGVKPSHAHTDSDDSWKASERDYLHQEWSKQQEEQTALHLDGSPLEQPPRSLPTPNTSSLPPQQPPLPLPSPNIQSTPFNPPLPTRPLPDPKAYTATSQSQNLNRTERFLSSNPAPTPAPLRTNFPPEMGLTSTSEIDAENSRRQASQEKTRAGGWASKSLLEREMERERERQREWEAAQKETKEAASKSGGGKREGEGTGPGESWDVNQYGYLGGDSQNRGGIVFGGRRQIIGPRPKP